MSEEKKKQVRKVAVAIKIGDDVVGTDVYKVVVPPDSTVEQALEDRLAYIKDEPTASWNIVNDELVKEV